MSAGTHRALRPWFVAACVFGIVVGIAGPLAWFGGYVTPDGSSYLEVAGAIANGGDASHVTPWGDGRREAFTVWPLGYPILVAVASWATGLAALPASKLLGFALLAGILAMVARLDEKPGLALVVFMLPSSLRIFTYSWSEQLFLFAVFATVVAWRAVDRRPRLWPVLAATMFLAFLARYIGLVVPLAVIAVAVILPLPRRRHVVVAGGVALLADAVYLARNWLLVGHATGVERIPAPEPLTELCFAFVRSIGMDAAPFVLVLGVVALGLRRTRWCELASFVNAHRSAVRCIAIGVAYLGALFILRSTRHFDPFNPRLTFPGVAPVLVGVSLLARPPAWIRAATVAAVGMYLAVWVGSQVKHVDPKHDAQARLAATEATYAGVPEGAVIVYGTQRPSYLSGTKRLVRPDLVVVGPRYAPYHRPETGAAFARRLLEVHAAHPDAPCFVDFTAEPDSDGLAEHLLRGGVTTGATSMLVAVFRPGTLVPLPGCRLDTGLRRAHG